MLFNNYLTFYNVKIFHILLGLILIRINFKAADGDHRQEAESRKQKAESTFVQSILTSSSCLQNKI